ncbi:hypothetical protein, partial [Burkholderia pseudomallei]|uniref:hypothetical protein n=1 Tax=Burkholderia pseudomallei TaxID=28450 RepID=UPI001F4022A6
DRAIPPPDIHKIRRQVTQSFSKAPRFSAMNLFYARRGGACRLHAAARMPLPHAERMLSRASRPRMSLARRRPPVVPTPPPARRHMAAT